MVSHLQQQKTHTATCLAQATDLNILKFQSPFENKILTVHISLSQIYQHQSGGTRIKQPKQTCSEIEDDGGLVLVLGSCPGLVASPSTARAPIHGRCKIGAEDR